MAAGASYTAGRAVPPLLFGEFHASFALSPMSSERDEAPRLPGDDDEVRQRLVALGADELVRRCRNARLFEAQGAPDEGRVRHVDLVNLLAPHARIGGARNHIVVDWPAVKLGLV